MVCFHFLFTCLFLQLRTASKSEAKAFESNLYNNNNKLYKIK